MRARLALLLVFVAVVGCNSGRRKSLPGAVSSAQTTAAPSAAPVQPSAAKALAGGGHWQLVKQGKQPGPQLPARMSANVTVWDASGKRIFPPTLSKGGSVVDLQNLPPAVLEMIRITGMGGVARAWFPPEAMEDWKPKTFPEGPLTYQLEIIGEVEPAQSQIYSSPSQVPGAVSAPTASSVAPPDLAGSPKEARATSSGLRYVVSEPGRGARLIGANKVHLSINAWSARGLTVEQVERNLAVTLTTASAPAGLGEVLAQLGVDGRARIWVPANKAKDLFPQHKEQALIVDVTLRGSERD